MKFAIEHISKKSGRLGQLLIQWENTEGGKHLKTPLLMQTTKGGSIPYLSADVFGYVSKDSQVLQLTLSTMDQMADSVEQFGKGLSAYVGYAGFPNVLLLRDPCETTPSGGNDRDIVPIYTRRGKESLTAQRYMQLITAFGPDIYQGLCDSDTNATSSKKRVQKSVDRTERFMDYCYEHATNKSTLLAPIVGGYNTYARSQSIKHARSKPTNSYGGYVLEGFHNNGLSASYLDVTQLLPIVEHCIKELEPEKPRIMPGAYSPLMLLELIRLGVDVFDTSYAYCAAINFKALTFSYEVDKTEELAPTPFLDVADEAFKDDFTPLLSNCSCLSCTKHTRAYLHHLYSTNELLGPILLMMHNLHHYMAFFDTIRQSIATDKLPELVEYLKYQNRKTVVDYTISEHVKVLTKSVKSLVSDSEKVDL